MRSRSWLSFFVGLVCLAPAVLQAQNNLVLDGGTMTLGGIRRYDNVCLTNGAVLTVEAYNASSTSQTKKRDTGNLELIAGSVYIDSTSKIVARGKGYQPGLCREGDSPTATGGGRGGCSVMDSGGGGAHFGRGGRGTVDNPLGTSNVWQNGFPTAFEDDCDIDFVPASGSTAASCALNNNSRTLCWKGFLNPPSDDGASCPSPPCVGATVAGQAYWHNIYEPEFGAAGGDKGCRDGDGRSGNPMAGAGGGRVVLVGLAARNAANHASPCGMAQGVVRIDGSIDANGKRGCGVGNDSAGGGAGGSVLIVGEEVQVGASAAISAAGGLGGDTFGTVGAPAYADCPAGAQYGGTCDDCGGGGGGGIISVLSVHSELDPHAEFDVGGEVGGTCSICNGEAGGGAGELQLDGAYVGEYCDGFDNDFDGVADGMEDFGTQSCGLGSCAKDIAACSSGVPVTCVPDISGGDACLAQAKDGRPRIAVIIDTSASMLLDLEGHPTFGDGGDAHRGLDTSGDGVPNDSRLFLAREALGQVLSAYPEIDFSLARYHQDQGSKRSCQTAKWFECQGLVASYDDPAGNTGSKMCDVSLGPDVTPMTVAVNEEPAPTDSECINYAGSCGPPRRGADVLSGFGTPVRDIVRWMDGKESAFDPSTNPGDVCLHSQGKDCELRGSGPTPLAGALQAVEDYVAPIRRMDSAAQPSAMFPDGCRDYNVILVTDGAESCNGDPVQAAGNLLANKIKTSVVAVSVLPEERASLNAIAAAGGTALATFVTQPEELVPALTAIIADSIRYELCNGLDDDCDGKTDEDFPGLGTACADDQKGICRSSGTIVCDGPQNTRCDYSMPGMAQRDEGTTCNDLDDDCDGLVDETLVCQCVKSGELCNGKDDDCDGRTDETDPAAGHECGNTTGECRPGTSRCVNGELRCVGGLSPSAEQCNGKDDDCDGLIDDSAPCPAASVCIDGVCRGPCGDSEFACPVGLECKHSALYDGDYCVPGACALCKSTERCENDVCVDPCTSVTCDDGLLCVRGSCLDCTSVGCPIGEICYAKKCQLDACAAVSCKAGQFCFNGTCIDQCDDAQCPSGQSCNDEGKCAKDPCAEASCRTGEVCREGQCAADPCQTMGCALGDVCVAALGCITDPCSATICGDNTTCAVGATGAPRCETPGVVRAPPPTHVTTAGSGLSTCSVGQPGGARSRAGHWLTLLGLLWVWRRRRCAGAVLLLALTVTLGGCSPHAICLTCEPSGSADRDASALDSGSLLPKRDANVDDDSGASDGVGGAGGAIRCTDLGSEVCNQLDDDCDGNIDEGFDFQTNVRHCGGCDLSCQADNADTSCENARCVVKSCLPGFGDLDSERGCEYRCPRFPSTAEDCNNTDDDCDGRIDEELTAPPVGAICRNAKGTQCENVKLSCTTRDQKLTTWYCDYPDSVDFDPIVPDGLSKQELRCDGVDNDCDGAVDEAWSDLGASCAEVSSTMCPGTRVCAQDKRGTTCAALPGTGPDKPELCNDIDDNCDGIVDNPTGDKRVIDDMIAVTHGSKTYYIYKFEASRPDATAANQGVSNVRSCSSGGKKPWTLVSYPVAAAACAVSGKRLCTSDEWLWACQGESERKYPYAGDYAADSCNGADHDAVSGGGLDNTVAVTGSLAMCQSEAGAFDLSGNVKEWTDAARGMTAANEPIYVVRGGSYESPQLGLTCQTELSQATASTVLAALGFRCCSDDAP